MKLLFVGTNRGGGGTESHFITLARSMKEAGHEVAAVVSPDSPIFKGLVGSGVILFPGYFRNAIDPRGINAVWQACKEFDPNWMVGSFSKEYWPLIILAKLLKVKLALFKHMDFPMKAATNYFIPRLADHFIVISNFMAKRFVARGVPAEQIRVLYNPLNMDNFKPDRDLRQTSRQTLGYADDEIVIGFIGATHPDKGIFHLADAINQVMAQRPRCRALWVGEGPATHEFAAYLDRSGFAPRHSAHEWAVDVRPYYAAMDILAIPSVKSETFGRVSIEAQACGIPVLCSDIGGIPETLSPGVTGLLLPPGDISAWRDAIFTLLDDDNLRAQMSKRGRLWVGQHFSATVIAQQFAALLEKRVK